MQNINRWFGKSALLGAIVSLQFAAHTHAAVNIGTIQVQTIGHVYYTPYPNSAEPATPKYVTDFLIRQRLATGGGAVTPSVTANFDTNNQFVMTISAPPGKKFQVHPPAGQPVNLSGHLDWQGPYVLSNGPSYFGTMAVSFTGLEGLAPDFSASSTALSGLHGFFGFNDIRCTTISNDFAFTSITLTATVPSTNAGSGTWNYTSSPDNNFGLSYGTTQTNDPGPFISIVPATTTPPVMQITQELSGDVTISFTGGTLQAASDPAGTFTDVPGNPTGIYLIPKANLSAPQFFRTRTN